MAHDRTNEGADIFWPGYVDAVTNLVLNLLFLLTIMTIAVFMFAMELGRQHVTTTSPRTETPPSKMESAAPEVAEGAVPPESEAEALRQQIEALKKEVALARADTRSPQKVVVASSSPRIPEKSVDRADVGSDGLVVRYVADAVALTPEEASGLRASLGPIVGSGGARIEVTVPAGFSEAKRLGFYRAMSVRNLLIEMKVPAERIEVHVREGKPSSDAALVRVAPR